MKKIFTRISLLMLLLLVSMAVMADTSKNYKSTANAYARPNGTGGGTVYVAAPSGGTNGSWGASSTASKEEKATSAPTHTYSFQAKTKDGYTFDGWFENETGGTALTTNSSIDGGVQATESGATINRYARWTANTYTIIFHGNGSTSGSMSNLAMTYGTAKNLTSNDFSKVGYTFSGWAEGDPANAVKYSNEANVNNLTKVNGGEVNLYAKWTLNSYTVAYHGNGNTAGEMGNQSFNYGEEKNLTANAFSKSYTLDFDVDGGECATSQMVSTYNFGGWAESETGAAKYTDEQTVSNLTTSNNVTINLYVKWTGGAIQLPNASKASFNFEGWFIRNTDTKVGDGGAAYTPTANLDLVARWTKNQLTPSFGGSNTELKVDEEQTSAFLFNNTDGPVAHITVTSIDAINDGSGKVIEYNAATNTIIARNAGTATIYFTQAETEAVKEATSSTWTYTITKNDPSFTGSDYTELKVGELKITDHVYSNTSASKPSASSESNFYYTVDNIIFTKEALNNGTELLSLNGNELTALNAGSGQLTLHQKETYKYNAGSASFSIAIAKHTPEFSWNASAPYIHNTTKNNVFSSTNADCLYSFVSSDSTIAYVDGNTLRILTKAGTATITAKQDENYKWNEKSQNFSVTTSFQSNHVLFTYNEAKYNDVTITTAKESAQGTVWDSSSGVRLGGSSTKINEAPAYNWDDKYIVICIAGIPDKLSFKHRTNSGTATDPEWYVKESVDGNTWTDVWSTSSRSTSDQTVSNKELKTTTRYLKFCYSGNFAGYFKDITITEKKQFDVTATSFDFGTNYIKSNCASKTFDLKYANAGHKVTLTVNDPAFSVSPTEITTIGGEKVGTYTPITVSYSTANEHTATNATLTVQDELGNKKTITLKGKTIKYPQSLSWTTVPDAITYDDAATVLATNSVDTMQSHVYYVSSDSTVIDVNGAQLIAKKVGKATITAKSDETEMYYAATPISKEIEVKKIVPVLTAPTAANGITYGTSLSSLDLVGGSAARPNETNIPGTYTWQDDTQVLTAGTHNDVVVVFTPEDQTIYATNTATISVTVNKKELTVTADNKNVTYGEAAPEYSVQYAGFIEGESAANLGGELAFDCSYAAGSAVGTYDITPSGLTSGNYAITFTKGTLTVGQKALTITAENKETTYGAAAPEFTVSYDGFVGEETESVLGGELAFACEYASESNVGTYDITPSGLTSGNYAITFNKGTLTVGQKALTVTADNKTVTYGDAVPTYTASYEGFVNGQTVANLGGQIAFACDYAQGSAVNSYTITPSGLTSDNYAIEFVAGTLTVNKAAATVTAPTANALTYTGAAQTLISAGEATGGTIMYSLDGESWSTDLLTGTDAGVYTVYYKVVGDDNHNNIDAANINVTIAKAALTITADNKNVTYGDAAPEYSVQYAGFIEGESAANLGGELAFDCSYAAGSAVGTYDIAPKGLTSGNYAITFTKGTLTVGQKALTITAENKETTYGADAPAFTVSYDGFVGEETESVLGGELAFACEYAAGSAVDTYDITPSGLTSNNYAITFTKGTLTVDPKALKVTAENRAVTYGDAKPAFTVNYAGFVAEDDATALGGELAFACEYEAGNGVGEYDITASGLTSDNYAITFTKGTLTVNKAALTITAENKEVTYGAEAPAFTVSYDGWKGTDEPSVLTGELAFACEYEAGTGVGAYTITPSGLEAANYEIAFTAGTLTVNKAASSVVAPAAVENLVYNGGAQTLIAVGLAEGGELQYSLDGENWSTELPKAVNAGAYAVYYKVVGDANHNDIAVESIEATIGQKAFTVTAKNESVTYGDAKPDFSVSYEGFAGEETEAVLGGELAFACEYAAGSAVDTYDITPSGLTSNNYAITFTKGTLTVDPKALKVTAENRAVTYGDAKPAFTVAYEGFVGEESEDVLGGELAYACTYAAGSAVGTYDIIPSGLTSGNYEITFHNGTLSVGQKALTVKADDKAVTYGDAAPTYTASYDGFVNAETAENLGGELAFACEYAQGSAVNTYAITPSGLTSDNYAIEFVGGTLTVNKAASSVTAPTAVANLVYNGEAQELVVAGSANGGTLQYSLNNTDWSTELPEATEGGVYTVYYRVVGDANHSDIAAASINVTIDYTIAYDLAGGSVESANPTHYNAETAAFTLINPTREHYTFAGWTGSNGEEPQTELTIAQGSTGNRTYTATWTINQYTISFNSNGGSEVASITQNYGTEVTAPAAPTRTGYTFAGWNAEVPATMPAENVELTAQWTINKYTVTIAAGENGSVDVASIAEVPYGTAVAVNGNKLTIGETEVTATPKETTDEFTYAFANWTNAPEAITGATTITATFSATKRSYTVTFKNGETVLQSAEVEYGAIPAYNGATPVKAADAQYTYTFNGWDTELAAVTGDATYTATFNSTTNKYTVKFMNGEEVLQSSEVEYGTTPVYTGAIPTKNADAQYTYTFDGWDAELAAVTGDATYTATFNATTNKYTVKFVNGEAELQSSEVEYGQVPAYTGETPTKAATDEFTYTFAGWSPAVEAVTGEATYTAEFDSVRNSYTITWLNDDNSEIDHADVEYGVVPTHDDATKAATAQYTYTFTGWTPEVVAVTGEATYKAVFDSVVNQYTVVFNNYDGTELQSSKWNYGATPEYTGTTPTKAATEDFTYTFAGWDAEMAAVTGNAVYTAMFDSAAVEVPTPEKQAQWIVWEQDLPATLEVGDNTLQLQAEASSWLDIRYTSSDETIAYVDEFNNVVALKAGEVTITAHQDGNDTYKAAEPVAKTLTVKEKTITTAVEETEAQTKAIKVIRNDQVFIIRNGRTYTATGRLVE